MANFDQFGFLIDESGCFVDSSSTDSETESDADSTQQQITGRDGSGDIILSSSKQPDHTWKDPAFVLPHINIRRASRQSSADEWTSVLLQYQTAELEQTSTIKNKIQGMIRKGVCTEVRPSLWKAMLDCNALKMAANFNYKSHATALREQLVDLEVTEYGGQKTIDVLNNVDESIINRSEAGHLSVKIIRQIFLDLERTYPRHYKFMGDSAVAKEGRAELFRVLGVYARYNKAIGYTQGMSYLAGMLLMQLPDEEDAFWCLVSLMERNKYLQGYYDSSLSRTQSHAAVFKQLLTTRLPRLANHFEQHGVEVLMFLTQWFMCSYTNLPCWDTVLAIWDLLISSGMTAVFRVALGILLVYQKDLLNCRSMSSLMPKLLHIPKHLSSMNKLMPAIYSIEVEKWEVESLQAVIVEEQAGLAVRKRRLTTSSARKRCDSKRSKSNHNTGVRVMPSVNMLPVVKGASCPLIADTECRRSVWKSLMKAGTNIFTSASKSSAEGATSHTRDDYTSEDNIYRGLDGSEKNQNLIPNVSRTKRSTNQELLNISPIYSNLSPPITEKLRGKSARTMHAFRQFHTPTPLRPSQVINVSHSSPAEVELKPMNLRSMINQQP